MQDEDKTKDTNGKAVYMVLLVLVCCRISFLCVHLPLGKVDGYLDTIFLAPRKEPSGTMRTTSLDPDLAANSFS